MRSGGKYKDLIKRAKGETTLANEAIARAKRIQDEYVKQMLEKRERALLAGAALKITQEQREAERKQMILNLLLGGKKGNAKKFFKAWCKGVDLMRQDRRNDERKAAWRRSCRCSDGNHEATCFARALQDPAFQMPFDTVQQTGNAFFERPGGEQKTVNFRATVSMPDLLTQRQNSSLTGHMTAQFPDQSAAPLPFLEGDVTAVAHHASGRKCFVDSLYRMVFAPELPRSRADLSQRAASTGGFGGYASTFGSPGSRLAAGSQGAASAFPSALTMGPSAGASSNAFRDAPRGRMASTFHG